MEAHMTEVLSKAEKMDYEPRAVAAAFLATTFCWPDMLAVFLDYWRTQMTPLGLENLSFFSNGPGGGVDEEPEAAATTAEQDPALKACLEGLHFFAAARLVDVEALLQENALPAKTDIGTRAFLMVRFVFSTPSGTRTLALDDEFFAAHTDMGWPHMLQPVEFDTLLAHMAARPQEFWAASTHAGMVGHEYYSVFSKAEELGLLYMRPAILILTQVYRSFQALLVQHLQETDAAGAKEAVEQDDALLIQAILQWADTLARGMVVDHDTWRNKPLELLDSQTRQLPFSFSCRDEDTRQILTRLYLLLTACQMPHQVLDLVVELRALVLEEVYQPCRRLYQQAKHGGWKHVLPEPDTMQWEHPAQPLALEDVFDMLRQ